jgi:hypothetical protein
VIGALLIFFGAFLLGAVVRLDVVGGSATPTETMSEGLARLTAAGRGE